MEKKIPWEGERPREPQVREGERPREPQIVFAERGKEAEYAIVISAEAGASVRYAAEELRDYVRRMTGVELPIVGEGVGDVATHKAVYLRDDGGRAGSPLPAVAAVAGRPPYQDDSFRIYTDNGNLYVIGGKRGVLYGVYELLETYGGVGWFSSWRTVVPKRESFAVPADLDDAQSPAFAMRSTSWWDVRAHSPTNVQNVAFAAHMRLNGDRNIPRGEAGEKYGGAPYFFGGGLRDRHGGGSRRDAQRGAGQVRERQDGHRRKGGQATPDALRLDAPVRHAEPRIRSGRPVPCARACEGGQENGREGLTWLDTTKKDACTAFVRRNGRETMLVVQNWTGQPVKCGVSFNVANAKVAYYLAADETDRSVRGKVSATPLFSRGATYSADGTFSLGWRVAPSQPQAAQRGIRRAAVYQRRVRRGCVVRRVRSR